MGKLGKDRGVQIGAVGKHKRVDGRLHLACKLLEHQVLVLHLVGETRRLKQPLTIPEQVGRPGGIGGNLRHAGQVGQQPLVDETEITRAQNGQLVGLYQPVVLRVEAGVHSG